MTNYEYVRQFNGLHVNTINDEQKLAWLERLDMRITDEYLSSIDTLSKLTEFAPATERELLVQEPYSELYQYYLEMQIAHIQGEDTQYNNSAAAFRDAYMSYGDYICRTYPSPKAHWRLY